MFIPAWQTLYQHTTMPQHWRAWLQHADSMTRALEVASGISCKINVQKASWQVPWLDECERLGCEKACWIREVVISNGQPVMFARSVFPRHVIEHFPKLLALGSQPLGSMLFSDATFQRGSIEVAEVTAGLALLEQVPLSLRPEKAWARRSLFHSSVSSFLLSELFLPYVATL